MGTARVLTTAMAVAAAIIVLPLIAAATPITFYGSDGTHSASATFEVIGGDLVVTLTNTSPSDATLTTDILTAMFFTATGNPLFTRTSVVLDTGSTTTAYPSGSGSGTEAGGAVGGEWSYLNSLAVFGNNEGLSSSGLGVFGPGNLFPGANLEGPDSPDGLQYGITSPGDDQATGNGDIQNVTLIQNSVVFHLGLNGNDTFDPYRDITGVSFLYGTTLTDPVLTGGCLTNCVRETEQVPQPGTLALLGSSLLGLLGWAARRRITR